MLCQEVGRGLRYPQTHNEETAMAKQHHWLVHLTSPDGNTMYEGRHNSEAAARDRARQKCTDAGHDPDTYTEHAHEIVGPAPQTFTGNPT